MEPAARPTSLWRALRPSLRYLMQTEVHVFAFSISANMLLSFFPFLIVMISVFQKLLHWQGAANAVYYVLLNDYFPPDLDAFIVRNLKVTVPSGAFQAVSVLLLLFTANGIFEPLEVALNRVHGCKSNRSFLRNQLISFGLIFACGGLAMLSTVFTSANTQLLSGVNSRVADFSAMLFFKLAAIPISMFILFLIYWLLPNCRVKARDVIPAAIVVGLLLEILKYVNLLTWRWMSVKMSREYGPFHYSVTLILWGFLASMLILAGAEWSARGSSESVPEPR